jgi:hypothetical protein
VRAFAKKWGMDYDERGYFEVRALLTLNSPA